MKIYAGTQLTLTQEFRDGNGDLADPGQVTFDWSITRDGAINSPEPTKTAVGQYEVTFSTEPHRVGQLYGLWTGTAPIERTYPARLSIHNPAEIQG